MKIVKIILSMITVALVVIGLAGCGSGDETTAQNQIASVRRGNLTLDITAAGNLALSTIEDLTFDLFYQKGTVGEVTVAEGDPVTSGQVLASLDASEWDDQLQMLEDALTAAQRQANTKERALSSARRQVATKEQSLAAARRQVTTKEAAVTAAVRQVTAKELAESQAEIDLKTADYNLEAIDEVKAQQDLIDYANGRLEFIDLKILESVSPGADALDYQFWTNEKTRVQTTLAVAQQEKASILAGHSLNVGESVAIEVSRKQLACETALMNLENATQAIADAKTAVEDARTVVEDAKTAVANAQEDVEYARADVAAAQLDLDDANRAAENAGKTLEEARAASPQITAPFDGFITRVNVSGGDEVLKGTVAIQLADPDQFEADILVSEMDILQVALGGDATVSVDAMNGVSLPAKVTQIAPTATIQSGVVNYSVKVEVEQQSAAVFETPSANQTAASDNTTVQIPPMLQRAIDAGRISWEQAEEIIKQGGSFRLPSGATPPAGFSPPEGFKPPEGFAPPGEMIIIGGDDSLATGGQARSQVPSVSTENYQLREGLTVTVSIVVAERNDVLLVPNAAVTTEGFESYVQVVAASGETEKRAVKTGLSDWQYTEITEGLTEGEQVLVPLNTSTSTSNSNQPGGMGFFRAIR
ncbi:MAG: hypothetical protein A2Z29_00010 [Chloroflexi bacterium RBG_16_56_11]|nr:MAG: hypothetical protein A2Z29_00010 [Chloroflexi bacterium RBG_16_56_11]